MGGRGAAHRRIDRRRAGREVAVSEPARNNLIVYGLLQYPLRATIRDHLYSFRRHGRGRYFYLNIAARRPPGWLREVDFDTVIFHHTLTGQRMAPSLLRWQLRRARALDGLGPLPDRDGPGRVRLHRRDRRLHRRVRDRPPVLGRAAVGVARRSTRARPPPGVRFSQNLTGYLVGRDGRARGPDRRRVPRAADRHRLPGLGRAALVRAPRPAAPPARGRVRAGRGRARATHRPLHRPRRHHPRRRLVPLPGLVQVRDRRRGGRHDPGRRRDLQAAHRGVPGQAPGRVLREVEAACFPGEDGRLQLFAISPRHLEACATRTCQVLVEGDYSGVLRPGEHYIPSAARTSPTSTTCSSRSRATSSASALTENAYRDVVASGRYGYERFVGRGRAGGGRGARAQGRRGRPAPPAANGAGPQAPPLPTLHRRAERLDRTSWRRVAAAVRWARALRRARGTLLPGSLGLSRRSRLP